jgi:hypothetical protein
LIGGQPHVGPPAGVAITLSNGGTVREGFPLNRELINLYRELPADYDPASLAHDQAGSILGGYYDIWNDRFFFTGYSAILTLARHPTRTETATLVPGVYENAWIHLSVGEAAKVGLGEYQDSLIGAYGKQGQEELTQILARGVPQED